MKTPEQITSKCFEIVWELSLTSPPTSLRLYLENQLTTLVWVLGDDISEELAEQVEPYL